MFDSLPEKPSAFAYHWLIVFGLGGGMLGIAAAALLFGSRFIQDSETGTIASFLVGAVVAVVLGRRKLFPPQPPAEG